MPPRRLSSLALGALVTLPAAAQPGEEEIVVLGRRLAGISVTMARNPAGKLECSISQSSGSARLDEQLCRTAAKCVKTGAADVAACVDARKPALLADLRRAMAREARP